MCGMELVIEELFYPKEASNRQTYATILDFGDELAERLLVEFQDASKVTHYYVNYLGVSIACPKTHPKRRKKDTASVPTTINPKEILQHSEMLYHTWAMLLCTYQLLKHSHRETMTGDLGWTL